MKRFFFALTVSTVGLTTLAHADDGSWHAVVWNNKAFEGFHRAMITDDGTATREKCLFSLGAMADRAAKDTSMTCVYVPVAGN